MKRQLLLLAFLFCFGCSLTPDKKKGVLKIAFSSYPTTVDPRKSGDFISSTLACLVYEGLTRSLPGNENIELALAHNVEISSDKRVYTFFLREAYWSDGHPVTAFDFEKSWKKILDPHFPSLSAFLLFSIENAEEYAKGQAPLDSVGILAIDEKTLQVTLKHPTPYFLGLTAFPLFLPIPSHLENGPDWEQKLEKGLVVNGPFSVAEVVFEAKIALKKNSSFWNKDNILLEGIEIAIVSSEATALTMFENRELDWLGTPLSPLPLDALSTLTKKADLTFHPMAASTFIAFNTKEGPFVNKDLRKAFSYSIDRETLVQEIVGVGHVPATTALPPSLSTSSSKLYSFDPTLARKHLENAPLSLRKAPITLYFKQGQIEKRLSQALQKQWKEILGIEVRLQEFDPKTHIAKLHANDFHISLANWIAQFHDPINLLERCKHPQNPKNFGRWENRRFQELLDLASLEINGEKRGQSFEEAEKVLADECPLAPIYHWSSSSISSPRLKYLSFTQSGGVLFERCFIQDD